MKNIYLFICLIFCAHFAIAQNSALIFDGQNEYLTAPANPSHNIGDGFTIEAWILADEWRQNKWEGSIVNKDGHGAGLIRGYAFRCGDNGTLSFVVGTDNDWQEAFSGQIMNTNQWHHVVAVVDNGTITLYVDGQPAANQTYSGNEVESELELFIGASPGFGGRNFSGVIDEVRIWSVARTQAEINDNMTADLTGQEANLVAYYNLNEGEGLVAGDLSSTANSAQLIDMDDSNWVDGYKLPDFDISVQRVFGIDVVNMKNRPVKFNTLLQNSGLEDISGFDLEVYIDEEFIFSETISSTIVSGELLNYQFVIPIDLTGLDIAEIEVRANYSADENALNNTAITSVVAGDDDRIIVSNNEQHNFGNAGQLNTKLITLPGDLHKYEQILMHIAVSCPSSGCDPWDQYGNIMVATQSGTYELARFITPYGIACGNWVVDITDFKSVLGGQVEFQNFIQVWGTSGWLLDAQIELIDNSSTDEYSVITPLWENSYLVYGDPGISHDLDEINLDVDANTANSHMRMTISGHGQGNTNNAAEFFAVTHSLEVDGNNFDDHYLWKADCATNACDDQAGNWAFPRAGWCPGQEVAPYIINTSSVANAGGNTDFDYALEDYTNLLNTGYNNSGHTEPHYKLYSYFVETSSNPYEDYRNLTANSVTGNLSGNTFESAVVNLSNTGFSDVGSFMINIFNNNELIGSEVYIGATAPGFVGDREVPINQTVDITTGNTLYAEVVSDGDDNPGDNVVKTQLTSDLNEGSDAANYFNIFPNPTSDGRLNLEYDEYWEGSIVNIFSNDGKLVKEFIVSKNVEAIELNSDGIYWYNLINPDGAQLSGKLVFVK